MDDRTDWADRIEAVHHMVENVRQSVEVLREELEWLTNRGMPVIERKFEAQAEQIEQLAARVKTAEKKLR